MGLAFLTTFLIFIGSLKAAVTYLWRAIPLLIVALLYVLIFNFVGSLIACRFSVSEPFSDYAAFYHSLLAGVLVFVAISYSVIQWKITSQSDIVAAQARFYRTELYRLAYDLQEEHGETGGINNIKGLAESLDLLSHTPDDFSWTLADRWLQSIVQGPEFNLVPPLLAVGVKNLETSYRRLQWYQVSTSATLSYTVFAAYAIIGFVISGPYSENVGALAGSIVVIVVSVQSVIRFVSFSPNLVLGPLPARI